MKKATPGSWSKGKKKTGGRKKGVTNKVTLEIKQLVKRMDRPFLTIC